MATNPNNVKFAKASSYEKMLTMISKGKVDQNDIVLVLGKGLYVIDSNLQPIEYNEMPQEFSSVEDAEDYLNSSKSTHTGMQVVINGITYVVDKENNKYVVSPVGNTTATSDDISNLFK